MRALLTENERAKLRAAANIRKDYSKENPALEAAITLIKAKNQKAFHNEHSIHWRLFMNEPRQPHHEVPRAGSKYAAPKGV